MLSKVGGVHCSYSKGQIQNNKQRAGPHSDTLILCGLLAHLHTVYVDNNNALNGSSDAVLHLSLSDISLTFVKN